MTDLDMEVSEGAFRRGFKCTAVEHNKAMYAVVLAAKKFAANNMRPEGKDPVLDVLWEAIRTHDLAENRCRELEGKAKKRGIDLRFPEIHSPDKKVDLGYYEPVGISGISLTRVGDDAVVSVEIKDRPVDVIREHAEGNFSHHVTAGGIRAEAERQAKEEATA